MYISAMCWGVPCKVNTRLRKIIPYRPIHVSAKRSVETTSKICRNLPKMIVYKECIKSMHDNLRVQLFNQTERTDGNTSNSFGYTVIESRAPVYELDKTTTLCGT